MYIVINNKLQKSYVCKTATKVKELIGCHLNTVLNNKSSYNWCFKDFIIYNPEKEFLVGKKRGKSL